MRLELEEREVRVVLNRRDILTLRHKLDTGAGTPRLTSRNVWHGDSQASKVHFVVEIEDEAPNLRRRLASHRRAERESRSETASGRSFVLPEPACPVGHPLEQLFELLSPYEIHELHKWLDVRTMTVCSGSRWIDHEKRYVATECAASPHGLVLSPNDADAFARFIERERDELESRPGVRPYRHERDRLHAWVFDQDEVWVDWHGHEHEIARMPLDYVENVIRFCEEQPHRIRVALDLFELEESARVAALVPSAEESNPAIVRIAARHTLSAIEWLRTTPLHIALRRRLEDQGR